MSSVTVDSMGPVGVTEAKEKDIREDIAWAQINHDVLKSMERPRLTFWAIFAGAFAMFLVGVGCEIYQYQTGHGRVRDEQPERVGPVHRHLHLLDRHEPFGHAAVGDPAHHSRRLAQADLSLRRGDDHLFADDGRACS